MVCASVREDNPRALASELSPVQTQNHTILRLLHQHAIAFCALRYIWPINIGVSMKGATSASFSKSLPTKVVDVY